MKKLFSQVKIWLKYYIVLALISPIVSLSQDSSNWAQIISPTTQLLNKLSFVDNNNGWVQGDGGTIINTTDGGMNWNTLYSAEDTFMLDIYFLNENLGWVLYWDLNPPIASKMLKTTDGGISWIPDNCPGEDTFFQSVYFLDSTNGFLAGSNIYKTSDGGYNWYEVNVFDVDTVPPNIAYLPVKKILFCNNQRGYACGGRFDLVGVMWWTSDAGENWAAKRLGPDPINDIYIFDSLSVIGLGGDPEGFFGIGKIVTSDGGITWSYEELELSGTVNALSFRTPLEGWAVKDNKFLFSNDGGAQWVELNTPGEAFLLDLVFTDSLTGYAVGTEGTILKYNSSITNVNEFINDGDQIEFTLFQNYPNPFNPFTVIEFSLPEDVQDAKLTIYNTLGEKVAEFVNSSLSAGRYSHQWDARDFAAGIYIYELKVDKFVSVKKMLMLK